jgi:hypothetical protein
MVDAEMTKGRVPEDQCRRDAGIAPPVLDVIIRRLLLALVNSPLYALERQHQSTEPP